jgi:Zn-dependent peptidase ImmA (M78 family)
MSALQMGFRVPGQSIPAIRKIAWNARQALGLADGRIDLAPFLERLIDYGIVLDVFDTMADPVGDGIEACWVANTRTLYLRDTVYADACRGGNRATFTICHELGHILLAHQRTTNRERPGPIPIYANSEWQANTFAAEFAMPLPLMNRRALWTADVVSSFFGVSMKAASIRLQKLAEEASNKK